MPPGARPVATDSPLVDSAKTYYTSVKGWLTSAAATKNDAEYSFKPATRPAADGKTIRTFGEILAHVAASNLLFCGAAAPGTVAAGATGPAPRTKAEIQQALATSFAFCDRVWLSTSDRNAATPATLPAELGPSTRLGVLIFNTDHLAEHYGNLVTYMRVDGLVPPSSR